MKPPSIVIVEQESESRDALMLAFESRGYMTWTCPALDMAMAVFLTAQPDVVLLDLDDDKERCLNFLQTWKQASPLTQVIIQTKQADEAQNQDVLNRGAHACLLKPVTPDVLFEALNDRKPVSVETR